MAKHKKIVYFIAGVSLVAMVWFVSREGYGIVINGNIMFPEYGGGQIYVTASSGKAVENFDPADLVIEKIPGPGPYRIMVPKNCGKVFLRASCGSQNYRWGLYSSVPFGVFSGNPLAIASDDVNNADITISLPDKKVMDSYQGQAVTVSGKIVFDGYKEGRIQIMAWSKDSKWGPPDIAVTEIAAPGPYSLRVPKGAGQIYIQARQYEPAIASYYEVDNTGWGRCRLNPLAIASDDVNNADITISLPDKKVMDSYQGQAVTVSGKIVFDGYKEGRIQIMAWSKDSKWGPPDIAVTEIAAPGPYSLRVPKGAGQIYIQARHCVSGRDGGPAGHSYFWPYRGELGISSVDREGIDILIPHRRSLF